MWAKLSSALKPRLTAQNVADGSNDAGLSSVFDEHLQRDRNAVKRPLRTAIPEQGPASPMMSPLLLPQTAHSSLQTLSSVSEMPLDHPPNHNAERRRSQDAFRSSEDISSSFHGRQNVMPLGHSKYGSVRPILRDGNTPATGQSVRFFSRDAYKMITPDMSATSSEPEQISFASRLRRVQKHSGHASQETSEDITPSMPSLMAPMPPPNVSNIFDLSAGAELPTIAQDSEAPLHDSAVEISEVDDVDRTPALSAQNHSRSMSVGQPGSMATGNDNPFISKSNRDRSMSDAAFHSAHSSTDKTPPATGAKGMSTAIAVQTPPQDKGKETDPFGTYASTYYTPGTVLPPTPQKASTQAPSNVEELIWSLQAQLALQSEMCVQFEVDLGARDQLVGVMRTKLGETERECDKRKAAIGRYRQRVQELERWVRSLQEEVERSREESLERIVVDEANGEAMTALQKRVEDLEKEKAEITRREQDARERAESRESELLNIKEELDKRGQERTGTPGPDRGNPASDAARRGEREKPLEDKGSLRHELSRKEADLQMLKAELEAQWKHTEIAGEKIQQLTRERDELRAEVDALNQRIADMEVDWSQNENRKGTLDGEMQQVRAAKEEAELQRNELENQLRAEQEHSENLTQTLQETEDRVCALEQERQPLMDKVKRLEVEVKQREADRRKLQERIATRERDVELAKAEADRMKRDYADILNGNSKTLQDVIAREVESRAAMEALVREKSDMEAQLRSMEDKIAALEGEVERTKRQLHALQKESADKEVRLVNLQKQHAQDKEDLRGLNIALDSKQQELELLKRRKNARLSGAASTATTTKAPRPHRESSIFGTPSVALSSRASSVLSDVESTVKQRKVVNVSVPSIAKPALTRNARPKSTSSTRTLESTITLNPARPPSVTDGPRKPISSRMSSPTMRTSPVFVPPATARPVSNNQRRPSLSSMLETPRIRLPAAPRYPPSTSESDDREKENTAPGFRARRRIALLA